MRVFISVELPEDIKKKMTEVINQLKEIKAAVKWVEPQNLHITMKFLGWIEDKNINNVIDLTSQAVDGIKSFKANFEGLGTFPSGNNPRIVWIGTEKGGDELINIANSLEKILSEAGYRSEDREFKPHITIGRIKERKGVDKLKEKINELANSHFGETIIQGISIMKSTLTPKGPVYEKIKEITLGTPE